MRDGNEDGWITYSGDGMPVHAKSVVDFRRRDELKPDVNWRPGEFIAGDLDWDHDNSGGDIIAYRVVNP